jgi:hypothetical protein
MTRALRAGNVVGMMDIIGPYRIRAVKGKGRSLWRRKVEYRRTM